MQNKILSNINSLIGDENPHFLLAVSGGVDSMVLLDLFQNKLVLINSFQLDDCSYLTKFLNQNYL